MGVSYSSGYFFGGPHHKDYSILGSILGSPYFGKLPNPQLQRDLNDLLVIPARQARGCGHRSDAAGADAQTCRASLRWTLGLTSIASTTMEPAENATCKYCLPLRWGSTWRFHVSLGEFAKRTSERYHHSIAADFPASGGRLTRR